VIIERMSIPPTTAGGLIMADDTQSEWPAKRRDQQ